MVNIIRKKTKYEPIVSKDSDKPSLVGINRDIGHYPFFIVSNKTVSTDRIAYFKGGHWQFSSADHPTYKDLDVFLGILKAYEDCGKRGLIESKSVQPKVMFNGECVYEEAESVYVSISISARALARYCGKPEDGASIRSIKESLLRFKKLTCTRFVGNPGEQGLNWDRTFSFITDMSDKKLGRNSYITITIDQSFLHLCSCRPERLLVRWREIQSLRSQVEKAVYLFLSTDSCTHVKEDRILKILGLMPLKEPKKLSSAREKRQYQDKVEEYTSRRKALVHDIKAALKKFSTEFNYKLLHSFEPARDINQHNRVYRLYKANGPNLPQEISDLESLADLDDAGF